MVQVRRAGIADVGGISEIEALSFPDGARTDSEVFSWLIQGAEGDTTDYTIMVAVESERVIGYLWLICQDGRTDGSVLKQGEKNVLQVAAIAVHPDWRGKGFASDLLKSVPHIAEMSTHQATRAIAETRIDNTASQKSYLRAGWLCVGGLRNYYAQNADAIRFEYIFRQS